MKVITVATLSQLVKQIGLHAFYHTVIDDLEREFTRWASVSKVPRHATHVDGGVIELMPCSNHQHYSFKYVNGHPNNPASGKLCVVALGLLSDTQSGYPLLLSEMTLLTAIRTAATAALAAKYLARPNSHRVAIIGNGAQSEFQVLAMATQFALTEVRYFDIDEKAMQKFANNLGGMCFTLKPCHSIPELVQDCDILITATADKQQNELLSAESLFSGLHVHAMGGDCPGKTEFNSDVLAQAKVVVEYLPQSLIEGEIQNSTAESVHAELWEIITGKKQGRINNQELTFFDSVGFALEDFSILKTVYRLSEEHGLGDSLGLIPEFHAQE